MCLKQEPCGKHRGGNVHLGDRISASLVLATVREERRCELLLPLKNLLIFPVDEELVKVATLEVGRIIVRELWLHRRQLRVSVRDTLLS